MVMRKVNFNKQIQQNTFRLNNFLGIDTTNNQSEVENFRSPDALNVILNEGGNLEKRTGIKQEVEFRGTGPTINQYDETVSLDYLKVSKMDGTYESVVFAQVKKYGTNEYYFNYKDHLGWHLYTGTYTLPVLPVRTRLIPIGTDGIHYLITGGFDDPNNLYLLEFDYITQSKPIVYNLMDNTIPIYEGLVYIPTTQISRSPSGSTSTNYEQINAIGAYAINTFLADGTSASYYPKTSTIMTGATVKVWVKTAGVWVLKTLTTHYTVSGDHITFTAGNIPPAPSVLGEDNVKIQFFDADGGKSAYVNCSKTFGKYGINGSTNYVFMGGYIDNGYVIPNNEQFFKAELPLQIGLDDCTTFGNKIVSYGNIGEYQSIHCENVSGNITIYIRNSAIDASGEAIFPVKQSVAGVGVLSPDTFVSLRGEPLWLSEYGVVSLATSSIGINSVQSRGYYIGGDIKGKDASNAVGFVFDNKYYLSIENEIYVADARYKYSQKDAMTTGFQYEWFKWKIMTKTFHINCQADVDGVCYIGAKGGIYSFKKETDVKPYEDVQINDFTGSTYPNWTSGVAYVFGNIVNVNAVGVFICIKPHTSSGSLTYSNETYWIKQVNTGFIPVLAYWTTPVLNMNNQSIKKTLKNLWVRVSKYANMSIKVYYSTDSLVPKYDVAGTYNYDYSRENFTVDTDPLVIPVNRQERKFMSIRFKIVSDDQYAFGLIEIFGKYTVNSQYRG